MNIDEKALKTLRDKIALKLCQKIQRTIDTSIHKIIEEEVEKFKFELVEKNEEFELVVKKKGPKDPF